MIPVLTLAEMREVERKAIEGGLTEQDLIRSAGDAVFQSIRAMLDHPHDEDALDGSSPHDGYDDDLSPPPAPGERYPSPRPPLVAFVCGKGHNGADGLAAALRCVQSGMLAHVFHVHADDYSPETRRLREQLAQADVPVHVIRSAVDLPVFEEADLLVDALLGSGLRSAPEGLYASLIHGLNRSDRPVLSVDVPSGISADHRVVHGPAVRADSTLCLGALKPAALFHPAAGHFGKIGYSPIAFDERALSGQPSRVSMYGFDDALDAVPLKNWRTNKYTAGKVLVIAGSLGMHGAPALCANAALRAGAGLVRVAVPSAVFNGLAPHLLEIIGMPVGSADTTHFDVAHVEPLLPWIEWADAIVLGPGLGNAPGTQAFLHALLPHLRGRRVVVDGDGLSLFASGAQAAPDPAGHDGFVLTPHVGEYRRMGGDYREDDVLATLADLRAMADRLGATVVLKGATTACARRHGDMVLSAGGNPGMATAGTGDVLAGILARELAVLPPADAAPLAVFLHGRAGDAARRDRGTSGMTASDLILYLPLALKELEDALAADDDDDADGLAD